MIELTFGDDARLRIAPDEVDVALNVTPKTYVVLKTLSVERLLREYTVFQERLRKSLLELMLMPVSEVVERYGQLGMNIKNNSKRADLEYGLIASDGEPRRFIHLKNGAVIEGMINVGVVEGRTVTGKQRSRLRDTDGGIVGVALSQKPAIRRRMLQMIFEDPEDLDQVIQVGQANLIGAKTLRATLTQHRSASDLLKEVAERTEAFFNEQATAGSEGSTAKGSGRIFAAPLFAQHLSAAGIWLQPLEHVSGMSYLVPARLLPIASWLAVPERHRPLADRIVSHHRAVRGQSGAVILNAFLAVAGSSTIWQAKELRAGPLAYFKEWVQSGRGGTKATSSNVLSSSINALFKECCAYFGQPLDSHPSAPVFFGNKRLARTGVDVFDWCERPTPRNTRSASRALGCPIAEVPRYVRDWAEELKELLPLFKRKNIKGLSECLDTWLVYLLFLGPEKAPLSLADIDRGRHINDYGRGDGVTYVEFLRQHYAPHNERIAYTAPSELQHAWQLAAIRDDFANRSNPIDPAEDRPTKAPVRRARTARKALDQKVLDIIIRENRRNDFELARTHGLRRSTNWRLVVDARTKRHESIFFPLTPILIDVIMHSGARNQQTAWLDSGEGDELAVDLASTAYVPNMLPTATKGRRQGFIQVHEIVDAKVRRPVLGMFLNTDKVNGKSYEVPWVDAEIASSVARLRELQVRYNPMRGPIPAIRPATTNKYVNVPVADVYPLFRDPTSPLFLPVTDTQIQFYWRDLLAHCQPIVNEELGYEYPLLRDERPVFDIHSLRVTTVTVLIENGVSPEIVQMLVGHKSVLMTFYYNAVRDASVHRSIQEAMDRRRQSGMALDDDAADELIRDAIESHVTLRAGDDFTGTDLLREHLERKTGFDLFTHGICPGGDCATGGERIGEGRYGPVWRPRACSGCRFRVTGPGFLAGLVHRLNSLMMEIKLSMQREGRLNDEAYAAQDEGRSAHSLLANAGREREDRDALWKEWCLEYQTVKAAEARLHAPEQESTALVLPASVRMDAVSLGSDEVHTFEHMHALVCESNLMPGASLDLPPGLNEMRDRLLFEVIRTQDIGSYFYKLDPASRSRALDRLGDLLVTHTNAPDRLQAVIDGTLRINEMPAMADGIAALSTVMTEKTIGRAA